MSSSRAIFEQAIHGSRGGDAARHVHSAGSHWLNPHEPIAMGGGPAAGRAATELLSCRSQLTGSASADGIVYKRKHPSHAIQFDPRRT